MRSPLKIAAPWSPCLSFYVNIADGGDVGRQPLSRKSRLREFMLALRPFNLRMQALRRPRTREWFDKGIARQSGAAMMSRGIFTAAIRHNRYTKHIFQGVISL